MNAKDKETQAQERTFKLIFSLLTKFAHNIQLSILDFCTLM